MKRVWFWPRAVCVIASTATIVGVLFGGCGGARYLNPPYTVTQLPKMLWPLAPDGRTAKPFDSDWHVAALASAGDEHAGVDIPAPADTPVRAAAAGTVRYAGGDCIVVEHYFEGRYYTTAYRHVNVRPGTTSGLSVAAGDKIGSVADNAPDTALHFGIRDREFDPASTPGVLVCRNDDRTDRTGFLERVVSAASFLPILGQA